MLTLICLLVICTAAVTLPSPARADYTITWCQNGANPPFTNGGTGGEPWNDIRYQCKSNPPVVELDNISVKVYPEEYDGYLAGEHTYKVTVTAPVGLTISRINTTLVSEPYKSGSLPEVQVGDDGGVIFSHMLAPREATWRYSINQALSPGDSTITIGDRCVLVVNTSCFFASPLGILTVASLSLTLHDDEQPSLSFAGGRILLPGAQSGTEDVTFSASAHQSGIAEVDAYLGSTLVGSDAYQSTQCSYTAFDPCPQRINDNLKVDTRWVPDGTYPLILEARDASGNTVSVESGNLITVANGASPASTSQGASANSHAPGPPNGHNATTKAQLIYLSGQRGQITVAGGQATNVSGRLTDQTGTPIPDATLDVLSQTVGSSAAFAVLGHATTNANGVYTFRVPPGPSRVIRAGYRAFANDSGYDATTDLTETVTATTSLNVIPKRLRGRFFTFDGRVHARDFPPGQQVEIQALVGRAWTHVTFARVAANGRFKARYRLKHHYHHVTFIFRATPIASPIWPYQPRESNHASLHLL